MRHNFASLPVKKAVGELENLAPEEIRGFLVASGMTNNPLKLREVVEASLTLMGGEEHSAIIEVLEPAEIEAVIEISPEIFSEEAFHLIQSGDYSNWSKWDILDRDQHDAIITSGDQSVIRRLMNFNPEAWTAKGKKEGPWGLFREDVVIFPEVVDAYFSAIINSSRSDEWKEQSIRAIGMDLLAYATGFCPEIYNTCHRFFPHVAENLRALRMRGVTMEQATDSYREAIERIQPELKKEGIEVDDMDLTGMLAELRSIGISSPTADNVKTLIETKQIEVLLREGIPE